MQLLFESGDYSVQHFQRCGDYGYRGRDGWGRRDGRKGSAWRINTENTETVGPLAHPETVQIVRTSHFSLNLYFFIYIARLISLTEAVEINSAALRRPIGWDL